MRLAAGMLVVMTLSACAEPVDEAADMPTKESKSTTTSVPETVTSTSAPSPTATERQQESVTLSAEGEQNTAPFHLDGGSYAVTFTFSGGCYYGADLQGASTDPGRPESLASGSGPVDGTTNVYKVDEGEYYVEMITGPPPSCPWSITLTAR
ncbi:MAG: hypothetical protein ACSLE3_01395 [Microbacteriaceae bacterium]